MVPTSACRLAWAIKREAARYTADRPESSEDMFRGLTKIRAILTLREQRRGLVVLSMMLIGALLEAGGVASVMPFLAVLGNPGLVDINPGLRWLYALGGFSSVDGFLFALGVGSFVLVVASALWRIATTYDGVPLTVEGGGSGESPC